MDIINLSSQIFNSEQSEGIINLSTEYFSNTFWRPDSNCIDFCNYHLMNQQQNINNIFPLLNIFILLVYLRYSKIFPKESKYLILFLLIYNLLALN